MCWITISSQNSSTVSVWRALPTKPCLNFNFLLFRLRFYLHNFAKCQQMSRFGIHRSLLARITVPHFSPASAPAPAPAFMVIFVPNECYICAHFERTVEMATHFAIEIEICGKEAAAKCRYNTNFILKIAFSSSRDLLTSKAVSLNRYEKNDLSRIHFGFSLDLLEKSLVLKYFEESSWMKRTELIWWVFEIRFSTTAILNP